MRIGHRAEFLPSVAALGAVAMDRVSQLRLPLAGPVDSGITVGGTAMLGRAMSGIGSSRRDRFSTVNFVWGCALGTLAALVLLLILYTALR